MANKISLSVAGMNLIVNTNEDEERVRRLTQILNADLRQVLDANPSASLTNAALLCCLDYLSQYDKASKGASNLRNQIKDYLAEAAKSKLEADEAGRKNEELTREISKLRERVTKLAAIETNSNTTEEALRKQLEAAKYEQGTLSRQLKELAEQNSTLQTSLSSQKETLESRNASISHFTDLIAQQTQQLDQQTRVMDDMKRSAENIKADRDGLLQKVMDLTEKLNELAKQHTTALKDKTDLESLLADAYAQADELRKVIARQDADAAAMQKEATQLRGQLEESTRALEESRQALELRSSFDFSYDLPDPQPEPEPELPAPAEEKDTLDTFSLDLGQDEIDEMVSRLTEEGAFNPTPEQPRAEEKPRVKMFDVDNGRTSGSGETGVEDDFKTFAQLIAEENRKNMHADVADAIEAKAQQAYKDPDDDMPDLSWINDI